MDQAQVESLVRVTARLSAAAFVAALIVFSIRRGHPARLRSAIRFLIAFIVVHTIHFAAVVWLALITDSENVRDRGGWTLLVPVAVLFYLAALAILRAWNNLAARSWISGGTRWAAHAGVVFIALVFLNSYLARVGPRPAYWVPAIVMIAAVTTYLSGFSGRMSR